MPLNPRPAEESDPNGDIVSNAVASRKGRWPAATVTFLTALYALGYLYWERSDWGSAELRDLIGNVAFMPLNVAVVIFNALASRSPVLDPGVRRALRLLAIGGAMVFIGNAISVTYLTVLHQNPTVSWADPFYLTDSLFTLAALLTFPLARRTRLERWKFVLDAAMVLVGGGVAIWYFSVRPTAAAEDNGVVVTAVAYAYPLASMLLLLGITTVLLRRPVDGNRLAFGLLVGGTLVSIIADLTFNWVTLMVGGRSAAWTDAVYLICYVMLIGSAERYYRRPVAITHSGPGGAPAGTAAEPAALPRRGLHLRPALHRGHRAVGRAGERPGHRGAPGHRARRGPPAPGRPGERAAPRRDGRPPERGAVPVAGAALLRRHHRHQGRRRDAVRQPLGRAGVRLRSLRADRPGAVRAAAPRGPRPRRRFLRRGGRGAGRHRPGGVALPPARRLVAPRRDCWRPTSCTTRRCAASCSTRAT